MPSKYYNRNFKSQHFYHLFNRGSYKNKVFIDQKDYQTFISILSYYLKSPTAKHLSYFPRIKKPLSRVKPPSDIPTIHLVAYCLMPNHFHLLVKQLPRANKKTNISNLMRRTMVTYALYFQSKYQHQGHLFQGKYRNVTVDTNEQLLYLSKYIHLNPSTIIKKSIKYPYSSLAIYLKQSEPLDWLYPNYVLELNHDYSKYLKQVDKQSQSQIDNFSTLTLDK